MQASYVRDRPEAVRSALKPSVPGSGAVPGGRAWPGSLGTPWPQAPVPLAAGHHRGIAARALPAEPQSCAAARDFTLASLRRWDLERIAQDATMIASELVTNALRHGIRYAVDSSASVRVDLTLWWRASHLLCVVTDPSSVPPALTPAYPEAESGRGLRVVQAIASGWGWTMLSERRKAVWAVLQLDGS